MLDNERFYMEIAIYTFSILIIILLLRQIKKQKVESRNIEAFLLKEDLVKTLNEAQRHLKLYKSSLRDKLTYLNNLDNKQLDELLAIEIEELKSDFIELKKEAEDFYENNIEFINKIEKFEPLCIDPSNINTCINRLDYILDLIENINIQYIGIKQKVGELE